MTDSSQSCEDMPSYEIGDVAPPPYIRQLIKMEVDAAINIAQEFLAGATVVSDDIAKTLTDKLIKSDVSPRTAALASACLQLQVQKKPDDDIQRELQRVFCTGEFHYAVHATNVVRKVQRGERLSVRHLQDIANISGKPVFVF